MALLERQRAGREIGRIRMGTSEAAVSKNNNPFQRPVKLSTWRLTSGSESIARAAAALFGGTAAFNDRIKEWDVITAATELPVLIPPTADDGDIVDQAWELWSGGECRRRCTGTVLTAIVGGEKKVGPCVCPTDYSERMALAKDARACKPTTRLNLIIPDLPDLGVWRLESHGYDAAEELAGTSQILKSARDSGMMLPARLWMSTRTRVVGGQTREWTVPMLSLVHTMRELAGFSDKLAAVMPAAPQVAITAGVGDRDPDEDLSGNYVSDTYVEHADAWAGEIVVDAPAAQAMADRAAVGSKPVVVALIAAATDGGHLDTYVNIDGADELLGVYLTARLEALGV